MVVTGQPDGPQTVDSEGASGRAVSETRAQERAGMVTAATLLVLGIGALDGGAVADAAAFRDQAERAMAAGRP